MHNLYILFFTLSICVVSITSAPAPDKNIFDTVVEYTSKICPALSTNVLIDKKTDFLSRCNDVHVENPPKYMDVINIKDFLCVGIVSADFHLCDLVNKTEYKALPKDYSQLKEHVESVSKTKPSEICNKLAQFTVYKDKNVNLHNWTSVLYSRLRGPECLRLCSDMSGNHTNILCSMLFYVDSHLEEIAKAAETVAPRILAEDTRHGEAPENVGKSPSENIAPKQTSQSTSGVAALQGQETLGAAVLPETHKNAATASSEKNQHVVTSQGPSEDISFGLGLSQPSDPQENASSKKVPNGPNSARTPNGDQPGQSQRGNPKSIAQQGDDFEEHLDTIVNPSKEVGTPAKSNEATETKPKSVDNDEIPSERAENVDKKLTTKPETSVIEKIPSKSDDKKQGAEESEKKDAVQAITTTEALKGNVDPDFEGDDGDPEEINDEDTNILTGKTQDLDGSRPVEQGPKKYYEVEDSNFFSYFMFISVMFIAGYVVYHNKQKIMALVLEGRRDRSSRRRPNTASYRKLNSNLEEAVTSKCSSSASHVIY